ncbi:MAG: hypothetical protein ACHQU1_10400 [Gemmatimonadales bacterium]
MTTDRIVVTVMGVVLSAWVLWYFLAPPRPAARSEAPPRKSRRSLDVLS